jgi:hypothetical protein
MPVTVPDALRACGLFIKNDARLHPIDAESRYYSVS